MTAWPIDVRDRLLRTVAPIAAAVPLRHVSDDGTRPSSGTSALCAADLGLVRDCLAGAGLAHDDLVQRFTPLAFSACRRSGLTPEDAQDVCQDAFVDVLRSLPRYRGESRLSTWMFTLVARRIADYFRGVRRRPVAAGAPGDPTFPEAGPSGVPDAEAQAIGAAADARLWREVEALGHPARLILVSYYLGDMPVAQIAAMLGIPAATVKTHLHRGRKALRERLNESHVDLR